MMTIPPTSDYLDPYRKAIEQHGAGFAATLWRSPEAQLLRFEVMMELIRFDGCTILDIGCGDGEMAAHLSEREVRYGRYIGIDAVNEMIEHARQRDLPQAEFHALDVLKQVGRLREFSPDYACISGTLNTMEEPTARSLVQAAYDAAAQGVIFNFLSDRAAPKWMQRDLSPARRFDTAAWVDWALSLSPNISFTQDYLDGHDATIVMHHGEV